MRFSASIPHSPGFGKSSFPCVDGGGGGGGVETGEISRQHTKGCPSRNPH